ncbi:MAG: lamin tail domain-containing protein [Pirellulales bacterium]|nr:lamin tail domain-containing protein [Pirellulales bacterium]
MATVVISEFLASSSGGLLDQDGESSDWIELYNTTSSPVNLQNWSLTDNAANLTKWRFPSTIIPANSFLVVFASDKNRAVAGQQLHTNFKLGADGEYLALVEANGTTKASEFTPAFPLQSTNISYGGAFGSTNSTLIGPNAPAKVLIPPNNSLNLTWTNPGFNDAGWLSGATGIGYENDPGSGTSYSGLISLNVANQMYNTRSTAYIRVPFTVANPATVNQLTLRMKYDDGFVAYLNGNSTAIASRQAPATLQYDSAATANRDESLALQYEDIVIPVTPGMLTAGTNMLAIHGLNFTSSSSDFVIQPELVSQSLTYNGTTLNYYTTPTPGAANSGGTTQGSVADTSFSVDRGFFSSPFSLVISSPTVDATIRYTVDGSTPTATTGLVYTAPITISGTTTVRAAAFKTGFVPSNVDTQTYIFVADVVNQSPTGSPPAGWPADRAINNHKFDYGIDPDIKNSALYGPQLQSALQAIPSISLVTDLPNLFDPATGIYVNPGNEGIAWERAASVELLNPDGSDGFQANAGLRIRGGFSRTPDNPKHAFRLFFRSEYGDAKLKFPLFGTAGAAEFDSIDLRTAQNYSWAFQNDGRMTLTRDAYSRLAMRDLGQPYTRGEYYHLYINGVYWGLFQTEERPEANFGATYFGGDESDYDVVKAEAGPYSTVATDGDLVAWQDLWTKVNQIAAEPNATNRFNLYQEIQGLFPNYTPDPSKPVLLDVDNLIDYMLVIFYGGNLDAPISAFLGNTAVNNWFGIRSRDPAARQGFQFLVHDSEHTLLNVNESRIGPYPAGQTFDKSNPQWLHQQLMAEPAYREAFNLRAQQTLRNNGVLTTAANQARHAELVNDLQLAIIGESARWGDVWKGAGESPFTQANFNSAVSEIINNFIPGRTGVLLSQLQGAGLYNSSAPLAPVASLPQGIVAAGTSLSLSNPSFGGTIYYTLNGTDPRNPDGSLNPAALVYSGPLIINDTIQLFSRTRNGSLWSGYTARTYATDTSALRITEIHYNPPAPSLGSPYTADDFEFIELQNTGVTPIDLQGVTIRGDVSYDFAAQTLAPGQFAVLVKNPAAFATLYPSITPWGTFTGVLTNGDGTVDLKNALGNQIVAAGYQDSWYTHTDGGGFSLVINSVATAVDSAAKRIYWRPSQLVNGNPGAVDAGLPLDAVVINEVLTNTTAASGDYIELYNTTNAAINIGGWYLSDAKTNLTKFRIPAGTIIPANDYLLYTQQTHFGNSGNPNALDTFSFTPVSGAAYLTSVDGSGNLAGYREDKDFAGAAAEVSFGRYVKTSGNSDFVQQSAKTPGAVNSGPIIGPIVINEFLSRPAPTQDEYIELRNISAQTVLLYDAAAPANVWTISNAINFSFPVNSSIPAGAYALVVPIDPATFRAKYSIPLSVQIFGPYTGGLNGSGELIRLNRPGAAFGPDIPRISVDHVDYDDNAPWPTEPANGAGKTYSRVTANAYANDYANWGTSRLIFGSPGAANTFSDLSPPTIPANLQAVVGGFGVGVTLTWNTARDFDSGVSGYLVYRNGVLIGNTPYATYIDQTVLPGVNYSYTVAAFNADQYASAPSSAVVVKLLGITGIAETTSTTLVVTFSESLTNAAATTAANYSLAPSINITSATLGGDQRTVTLTLASPLTTGTSYQLMISNVTAISGNILPSGTRVGFTPNLSGGGLRGAYYDELNFINFFANRNDPTINFSWGGIAPIAGMGTDNFSVRWTGAVQPRFSGTYTFYTLSDDGVRLSIDNQSLVDNWTYHGDTENSGSIYLQAGQLYEVKLEFFQGGGGATMALSWAGPNVGKQLIASNRMFTVPAVPASASGLTAMAASTSSVRLDWMDNSNGESQFLIERSTNNLTFAQIGVTAKNTTTYLDTTVTNGATYYYRVRSANVTGSSAPSNTATHTVNYLAPVTPGNLSATPSSTTSISLNWLDLSTNETLFKLQRSVDNINFVHLVNVAPNNTTFEDTGLTTGTTYYYRLATENASGVSTYTATASATPDLPPLITPSGLQAVIQSPAQIFLSWIDNNTTETGYLVERSTDGVNFNPLVTLPANSTSHLDGQLQSFVTYTYRVRAVRNASQSSPSGAAGGTPTLSQVTGTAVADLIHIRRAGSLLQVFVNSSLAGSPTYFAALADVPVLQIFSLGGNDILELDGGGQALSTNFIFDGGADANTLAVLTGSVSLNGTASGGMLNVAISANATMITDGLRGTTLSILSGGKLQVRPHGGAAGLVVLNNTALGAPALSLAADAILDLNDNDLVVYYSPAETQTLATITAALDNFYSFGLEAGQSVPILGSTTVTNSGGGRILAAVDNVNSQFGDTGNPFYDLTLGNSSLGTGFNQVVVRFTYPGDYNLDGQVDGSDYIVVDSNLGAVTPGLSAGWTLGDGDFDGIVSAADYLPIDSNFGSGVGNPLAGYHAHIESSTLPPSTEDEANELRNELFAAEHDWLYDPRIAAAWEQSAGFTGIKKRPVPQLWAI